MADPRYDDPNLNHKPATDTYAGVRPTDDLYADRANDPLRDAHATTVGEPRRNNSWGRIALIGAAVILGLALLSALFTGPEVEDGELATAPVIIEEVDPVVTGTVPDTADTVVVPVD